MTAKILAGLAAAVVLTLVGVYAATGSIPGVETAAEYIAPSLDAGPCSSHAPSSCCSAAAVSEVTTCGTPGEVSAACPADSLGACAGGVSAGVPVVSKKSGCCEE